MGLCSTFYPNQNLNMSFEIAEKIKQHIDDLNYTGKVSITGRGEPTLHPKFKEYSNIFMKNKKYKLKINTNGARLDKHLDTLLQYDIVNFNFYKDDWEGFEQTRDKYGKYGFNFYFKPPMNWYDNPIHRFTNRAGSFDPDKVYEGKCDRVFEKLFIDWNGDYKLCCEDWKDHITLGNIEDETIFNYVTKNPTLAKSRRMLAEGRRDLSPCSKCSYKFECSKSNMHKYSNLV